MCCSGGGGVFVEVGCAVVVVLEYLWRLHVL